jgi:hypothetical protein
MYCSWLSRSKYGEKTLLHSNSLRSQLEYYSYKKQLVILQIFLGHQGTLRKTKLTPKKRGKCTKHKPLHQPFSTVVNTRLYIRGHPHMMSWFKGVGVSETVTRYTISK